MIKQLIEEVKIAVELIKKLRAMPQKGFVLIGFYHFDTKEELIKRIDKTRLTHVFTHSFQKEGEVK
jgi:hypothetical protein